MTKLLAQKLGLNIIYDLIDAPSEMMAHVKRIKLKEPLGSAAEIAKAYEGRKSFIRILSENPQTEWQQIFSHINLIDPATYAAGGDLGIHELYELKLFLYYYARLRQLLNGQEYKQYPLPNLSQLFDLLDPEGGNIPSFRLSPLYSKSLGSLVNKRQQLAHKLKHKLAATLHEARQQLLIPNLKEEFVLSRSQAQLIEQVQASGYFIVSGESIANLSFRLADSAETNSLKQQIASLNQAITTAEEKVLNRLSGKIQRQAKNLAIAVQSVFSISWDYMLAAFAMRYHCCIPTLATKSTQSLKVTDAVNLPLKLALKAQNREYQPLQLIFSQSANLITGPNMGGKTNILKLVAQICELTRYAIPIPATTAQVPVYDFIYYNHTQESDSLSSFGAEVVAFCTALKHKGKGLFLLDEIAKGTNPTEGEAIATAIIKYLSETHHTCISATHFTAPAMLQDIRQYRIAGIPKDFKLSRSESGELGKSLKHLANAMDYNLIPLKKHTAPAMDAIRIAAVLGLPDEILRLLGH